VIETTGRKSGKTYRTPVLATVFGGRVFASTIRGHTAQWLKNLSADPEVRYWQGGHPHKADAVVYSQEARVPRPEDFPPVLRPIVPWLAWWVDRGAGFAVLTPRAEAHY
jgi:deazaflavin-dependent oxidoreductase (nitroreductase family)